MVSLSDLLRSAGLSRETAAEIADVSKQSVDNWCSSRVAPSLEHISRLALHLRSKSVPEDDLCNWVTEELAKRGMDAGVLAMGRRSPILCGEIGSGIVVLGNPAHRPSYRAITAGLAAELYAEGIQNISYLDASNRRDFLNRYLQAPAVSKNRGAIILGLSLEDYEFRQIASTASEEAPIVFVQNRPSDLPPNCGFVGLDNYGAAKLATEHLWDRGYRKIAAIGVESETADRSHTDRIEGYCDSIRELGGEPHLVLAFGALSHSVVPADLPDLREAVELVIRDHSVDALLALNSDVAREAVKALHDRSQTPGVDLAIVSIGCREWMHDICRPPLSHIALPQYGAGRRAARMLLEIGGHYGEQSPREQIVIMSPTAATDTLHSFEEGTIATAH